jgi:hypothetical protein
VLASTTSPPERFTPGKLPRWSGSELSAGTEPIARGELNLKRVVADLTFDNVVLKDLLAKHSDEVAFCLKIS